MKIRLHIFMMVIFLFSQSAKAINEQDQYSETSSSNLIIIFIVPVLITIFVHYILTPPANIPRSPRRTVAIETLKTLFTAVVAKTVWAPTESIFKNFYDTGAKKQNIRNEKDQKQEAILSNLDRALPQIRKYLEKNDSKAATDLMVNMMIRIWHLQAELDAYGGLIVKDTVEAMLLKRSSIPCDFYADTIGKIAEKDIRLRGKNMTYYEDLLEKWNMPKIFCSDSKQKSSNIYQGLVEKWKKPMESCSSTKP